MINCSGNKIHDLDYDVTRHWIHLNIHVQYMHKLDMS